MDELELKNKLVEYFRAETKQSDEIDRDNFRVIEDIERTPDTSNSKSITHRLNIRYRAKSEIIITYQFNLSDKLVEGLQIIPNKTLKFFDKLGLDVTPAHAKKYNQNIEDWWSDEKIKSES